MSENTHDDPPRISATVEKGNMEGPTTVILSVQGGPTDTLEDVEDSFDERLDHLLDHTEEETS